MRPCQLNLDLLGLDMSIHLLAKTSHYIHIFSSLFDYRDNYSNKVFVPYQVRAVIKKAVKSDRVNNKFIVL